MYVNFTFIFYFGLRLSDFNPAPLQELLSTVKEADSLFGDDRTWMCRVLGEESMLEALGELAAGDDQSMGAGQGVDVPADPVEVRAGSVIGNDHEPAHSILRRSAYGYQADNIQTGIVMAHSDGTYGYQADNIQTGIVMAQPVKEAAVESDPISPAESETDGQEGSAKEYDATAVAADYLPKPVMKPGRHVTKSPPKTSPKFTPAFVPDSQWLLEEYIEITEGETNDPLEKGKGAESSPRTPGDLRQIIHFSFCNPYLNSK